MRIIRIIVTATCLLAAVAGQASSTYEMSRLGRLNGDGYSSATRINAIGQILGTSTPYGTNDSRGAFLWSPATGMVDIQAEGQFDLPGGINNNGQVVGTADSGYGPRKAVLREANGGLVPLANLPGAYDAFAYALNDNGWVVGSSGGFAVLWQGNTTAQWIGGASGSESYALDINKTGSILWSESVYSQNQWIGIHSYIWQQGTSTLLQGLNATDGCYGYAINDSGVVVGTSGTHAVVWGIDGTVAVDLGVGMAHGINNHGQIVGCVGDGAKLWNMDGSTAADLGMFAGGNNLSAAYDINDSGWIAGAAGYNEYQDMEAVLWEPVPEPSSLLALAGGLAGLGASALRRKRR